jgi:hypothetical protein
MKGQTNKKNMGFKKQEFEEGRGKRKFQYNSQTTGLNNKWPITEHGRKH